MPGDRADAAPLAAESPRKPLLCMGLSGNAGGRTAWKRVSRCDRKSCCVNNLRQRSRRFCGPLSGNVPGQCPATSRASAFLVSTCVSGHGPAVVPAASATVSGTPYFSFFSLMEKFLVAATSLPLSISTKVSTVRRRGFFEVAFLVCRTAPWRLHTAQKPHNEFH